MASRRLFTARGENLSLVADAGDFFSLEGIVGRIAKILEVRVWQRGSTTLVMDTISMRRGAGAVLAGTSVVERSWDTTGTAPGLIAYTLPTVDVGTVDWEYSMGWNLLQEAHFLATPDMEIPLKEEDDFGLFTNASVAHTGVGVCVTWAEEGV